MLGEVDELVRLQVELVDFVEHALDGRAVVVLDYRFLVGVDRYELVGLFGWSCR